MKLYFLYSFKKQNTYEQNNKADFATNTYPSIFNICITHIIEYFLKFNKQQLCLLFISLSCCGIILGQVPKLSNSKYLLTPSAFQVKQDQIIYRKINLYINSIEAGYSDHFSLEAGFGKWYTYDERINTLSTLISLAGKNTSVYINPKVGFKLKDDLRIGGGTLFMYSSTFSNAFGQDKLLLCPYVILTQGTESHNFSVGTGWNMLDLLDEKMTQVPFLNFAGMTRISEKFALISENFFVPDGNFTAVFSYGVRFISNSVEVNLAFKKNPDVNYDILGVQTGKFYSDITFKF